MLLALICLQVQTAALTQQPTAIDMVTYQCVQNALPNGAPDLAAPDNYFIRVTSHYKLVTDSNKVDPDEEGNRVIKTEKSKSNEYEWFSQSKGIPKDLEDKFREVSPPYNKDDFKRHVTGWGESGEVENKVNRCYRYLSFERTTIIERVETHSKGKRQYTRTRGNESVGHQTSIVKAGDIFDPSTERAFWAQSKPEVRIDPVIYKYD